MDRTSGARMRFRPALALAALSALVPGIAHIFLRQRAGKLLLVAAAVLVAAALVVARSTGWTGLVRLAVEPGWLTALFAGALVLAAAWCAVVLWSFAIAKPLELSGSQRVLRPSCSSWSAWPSRRRSA